MSRSASAATTSSSAAASWPRSAERIAALRPGAKAAIVSDETVARHHLAATEAALAAAGIGATSVTVPPGESSKSFPGARAGLRSADRRAHRARAISCVALGGGVIGDLAGFAAAVVRRGLDYVQVPTTLLAQVDSSVGGKTAIDSRQGKNLVGAFHQPVLVVADTALLDTLPEREFRAGYAEVAKYGLLGDAAFFAWLEANWQEIFAGGPAREHAIAVSCRMKAAIVGRDERETGERALLNLGHTFGHAFEAAAGFSDRLLHGEAISLGMVLAFAVLGAARAAAGGGSRARRAPPCGGRPAGPRRFCCRRRAVCRSPDGAHRPGQEGQARQVDLHPGARHRRELHRARRRCRRGPRLSGAKARRTMSVEDWLSILVIVLCLGLSFFFSGSETALTAFSRARMLRMEKTGNRRAALVNRLLETRERLIGAILTGNNVVNIAASSLTTGLLLNWFGDVGVLYATMIMTVVVVVFTEVLPKTVAINAPDRVALLVVRPIAWVVRAVRTDAGRHRGAGALDSPVCSVFASGTDQAFLSAHEELRGAVDLLHHEGGVEKQDRDMLERPARPARSHRLRRHDPSHRDGHGVRR